jgi:CBS domain-containing protein
MKVADLMTANPACCSAQTRLQELAQLMVECDCGMIPVLDQDGRAIGAVTDRDIVCRTVAQGQNPLELTAEKVMTRPISTISPEADLEELTDLLEDRQIRRVIVADGDGRCVGVVAQADIARASSDAKVAEMVREVSRAQPQAPHAN